jgi:hypothetical protein
MARSRMSSSSRRPVLSVALASACACAAVALYPSEARAAHNGQFDLGIDGEAPVLLAPNPTQNNLSVVGGGFKIRFGDQFKLRGGIRLTPEVGYSFDRIFTGGAETPVAGEPGVIATDSWNMNRFFAGARLGFGRWIVPTVYAHAGYAFRSISGAGNTNAEIFGENGFTFDTGVALDFHIARHLSFGPHAEYVFVSNSDGAQSSPQWLAFGAHIDILF